MISLNTQNKLPGKALGYLLVGRGIIGVLLVVLGAFVISLGTINGTSTVNGVSSPTTIPAIIPGLVMIFFGFLLPIWAFLWYTTFSYIVAEQKITINSGILFRQSKTIDFSKIQNVDNVRGPLQMIFGLTGVQIWTASAGQVSFVTSSSRNGTSTSAQPKPDGLLLITRQDAEDLQNYITSKGTPQSTPVVTPSVPQAIS